MKGMLMCFKGEEGCCPRSQDCGDKRVHPLHTTSWFVVSSLHRTSPLVVKLLCDWSEVWSGRGLSLKV